MTHSMFLLALFAAAPALACVPEPDVIFYGRVTRSPFNTAYVPAGVTWSLSGNAETLAVSQTTVVSVNGETFYLTRIPFETRQLADHTPLPATPNTLSLPAEATPYTRSATVDGRPAILPADTGSFSYGAATQGLIERIDLVIGETFAEWSQRIFGSPPIDPNADPDHDGANNMTEYAAGTDPLNAQSNFKLISIQPAVPRGIAIQWSSVIGKSYTIQRSSDVDTNFVPYGAPIVATNIVTSMSDNSATGPGPYFYRLLTQ